MNKTQVVIYSHGFGVTKDDQGLFTDISNTLPEASHVMTDLNQFNEQNNELTVAPMQVQVARLQESFNKARADRPNAIFDLVCHSQGCVVAALAKLQPIRKVLFLAPPSELNVNQMSRLFADRPGTEINVNGVSRITRSDNSTTVVPNEYWKSIKPLSVIKLYNRLSELSKVQILSATDDEVLSGTNFDRTDSRIELQSLRGNHNFSGEYRKELVEYVQNYLVL